VVIAHVFYSYYFNNKINRFLRTQLMKKFFRLRGFYDKKTVLNIFNNDIRYLTGSREGIIVFPNQVFYLVVGIILNLLSIAISTKEEPNPNYNPI
jgi:hypothetical protein